MWHSVAPIKQFQVTQAESGSLDVSYVMERPLAAGEIARLERLLAERFGYAFRFRWIRVDAIARSAGGKYEDFVSLLV